MEPWWLDLKSAFELIPLAVQVRDARKAGRGFITKADGKPKKKASAKKTAAPEKADPLPPLEVVNIEDQVKAPEPEPEADPAPSIEPYSVEDAKAKAADIANLGQLRELYKEFESARRRGESTAEAVAVIASRSAELK